MIRCSPREAGTLAIAALLLSNGCLLQIGGNRSSDDPDDDGRSGGSGGPVGVGSFAELSPLAPLAGDHVGFVLDGRLLRLEAAPGAAAVDMTSAWEPLFEGEDESPFVSRNGDWVTVSTTRFDCAEYPCLGLIRRDGSYAHRVIAGGQLLHPEGRAAVSAAADLIVFPTGEREGPHDMDLYALVRNGEEWSEPRLITGQSTELYNDFPVLSADGSRVLFNCGRDPFYQSDTDICEVSVGGGQVTKRVISSAHPGGVTGDFSAHHGDYAGGGIVFEVDWEGEQVWFSTPGGDVERVIAEHGNDNSPCALPSGRIASLWLNRPGGTGLHELKVMSPDGSSFDVLTPDVDIADIGMNCFGSP